METATNKFEGWAVVELFGHAKEIGFVTTQYFGTACLFQIDVPGLDEREFILEKPQYLENGSGEGLKWTPAGSKVRRPRTEGRSPLVGPAAIYKLTPCTKDTAMKAIEEFSHRPLYLLELAKQPEQISLPGEIIARPGENEADFDRCCEECGHTPEEGHSDSCSFAMADEEEI